MAYCDLSEEIFADVHVTCDVSKGFEEEAIFILRKDVDFAKLKSYTSTVFSDTYLVPTSGDSILKSGKHGAVVMQLKNAFNGTQTDFSEGDNRNTVSNTVVFNVWSSDPDSAEKLDAMLNSTYVCILKQTYKGDENNSGYVGGAVYRVYGTTGSGLKMTGLTNNPYDDSIGNGWTVTMTETGCLNTMKFLQVKGADGEATEAATEAYFQALKG